MAAPLTLRRALLILDLQNEFLASSGRCKVSNFPIAPEKGPSFIDNILAFATAFRKAGSGDIIWIRSEFTKPRDANDEKVLLYEEESEDDQEAPEDRDEESDRIGKFDEFLSVPVNPYCAKGSPAADFYESVTEAAKTPGDRIIRKTWYSAFIKTGLVEILRGRLATELFICGLKTNISVFATVSDAVRHGFQVTVLDDCVGYSDQRLHDVALGQMAGVLGCEVTRSAGMVGAWTTKTKPARSTSATQTKEDLAQMIERLSLSEDKNKSLHVSPDPLIPSKEALEDFALQQEQKKPDTRRQGVEEGKSLRKIKGIPVLLKEGDKMGEGDTRLVNGILPPDFENVAFERLRHEIRWRTMLHRGGEVPRLVAVEGDVGEDGSFPIYRHPADESPPLRPFSPTVSIIRDHVQKVLNHPVNHVLIQYYRGGNDYISEHSDKTLDIVRGSFIVNVSLGAQRTMILRTKKDPKEWMERERGNEKGNEKEKEKEKENTDKDPRRMSKQPGVPRIIQRIPLPHNSMFVLGEATNRKWMHSIKQDKRHPSQLSPEEAAFGGERISLTFRHIGTFLGDCETKIWGQGATSKSKEAAKPVLENDQEEVESMVFAFGKENHQGEEFDWENVYGAGFDVLHFMNRLPRLLCRSQEDIGTLRVLLALSEKQVEIQIEESCKEEHSATEANEPAEGYDEDDVSFVDCDIDRTTVKGSIPILFYLETFYSGEQAMGGIGSQLFPTPARHERGPYTNVLSLLLESNRLWDAVKGYSKAISKPAPPPLSPSSTGSSDSPDNTEVTNGNYCATLVTPPLISLQTVLDNLESRLHRISLGPSGAVLGITKGEDDVCFGGVGLNKCWSAADCAIWPVLWKLETWRQEGALWKEIGEDDRWRQLRDYYRRGLERPEVARVFAEDEESLETKEGGGGGD